MSPTITAACSAEAGADEPAVNVAHSGLDELAELKLLAALADLDRAQFAGPAVDVLEEVMMDGAQMGQVEGAARNASAAAQDDKAALLLVEVVWIGGAEPISKERCAGVNVRVFDAAHLTRAAGLRARM